MLSQPWYYSSDGGVLHRIVRIAVWFLGLTELVLHSRGFRAGTAKFVGWPGIQTIFVRT